MSMSSLILHHENGSPNSPIEEDELPNLPMDIWREIGRRNRSRLDVTRFRSVCRTWRLSLPPPILFPLQIPHLPDPSLDNKSRPFFIAETTFYAAIAEPNSPPMIVAFEEMYKGGNFEASTLLHKKQFNRHKRLELPAVNKLSTLSFLSNSFHIHIAVEIKGEPACFCNFDVLKTVIISSDCSPNTNPNYSSLCELKVVVLLSRSRKLALLSLSGGAMNNNWVTGFNSNAFEDIINYKGKLYAVNTFGAAFVMDYHSLQMTQIAPALTDFRPLKPESNPKKPKSNPKKLHLSEVGDNLYMFSHDVLSLPQVSRLYRLSYGQQWIEAPHDLPDHVFVKDIRSNFAVPRNLIPRHTRKDNELLEVPRICASSDFNYIQLAVGFKNTYDPPVSMRPCDLLDISYIPWDRI